MSWFCKKWDLSQAIVELFLVDVLMKGNVRLRSSGEDSIEHERNFDGVGDDESSGSDLDDDDDEWGGDTSENNGEMSDGENPQHLSHEYFDSSVAVRRVRQLLESYPGGVSISEKQRADIRELSTPIIKNVDRIFKAFLSVLESVDAKTFLYPAFWFRLARESIEIPVSEQFLQRYSDWRVSEGKEGLTIFFCEDFNSDRSKARRLNFSGANQVYAYTLDDVVLGVGLEYPLTADWRMTRLPWPTQDSIAPKTLDMKALLFQENYDDLDDEHAAREWPFQSDNLREKEEDKSRMKSAVVGKSRVVLDEWNDEGFVVSDSIIHAEGTSGKRAVRLLKEAVQLAAKGKKIPGLANRRRNGRYECSSTRMELVEALKKHSTPLRSYSSANLIRAISAFVACRKA